MHSLRDQLVISVFGSHAPQAGSEAYESAREVGRLLAQAGLGVATGGYGGTMAAVSQGAAEAGGRVIGVASERIERLRGATLNRWVQEEFHYISLAERVMHLVTKNDGMIVLPGGIGTLSEFSLAWSFLQTGELIGRPLILLGDRWRETLDVFFDASMITRQNLELIDFARSPGEAVSLLEQKLVESA